MKQSIEIRNFLIERNIEHVKLGVSDVEIAEALGVAINLNTGAAITYSTHVLDSIDKLKQA